MKLYDGQRSPNARKIRLLAAEMGITLERERPDFQKGDLKKPEFLKINPNGKIPVLDDDGFILYESAAILKYLARKKPDLGLVPLDPKGIARLDQWLFWWAAHLESAIFSLAIEKRIKPFLGEEGNDASICKEASKNVDRYLPILEKELGDRKFLLGDQTIFDFDCAPWLELAPDLGVDMSKYPGLQAWLGRMQQKPYWKDA